jgi:hypothetical protein
VWIVFGWDKEEKVLGEVAAAYCYDCRRDSDWFVSRESEWVTLSAIRVFRFICKHRLHCGSCSAVFPLTTAEFKKIDRYMQQHGSINGTDLHTGLAKRIEMEQLASKTPLQLKFIRESMEAQKQYKSAIEAQNERDA